ncbi:MAG: hypothetical protein AAB874_07035 [Patescibacteria group bacterium]
MQRFAVSTSLVTGGRCIRKVMNVGELVIILETIGTHSQLYK